MSDKRIALPLFAFLLLFLVSSSSCRQRKKVERVHAGKTITAARSLFSEDDFIEALSGAYSEKEIPDSVWNKTKIHGPSEMMQHAYQVNNYQPFWIYENSDTALVSSLLQDIKNLENDGLNPEWYGYSKLSALFKEINTAKEVKLESLVAFDTACTRSYVEASHDLLLGRVVPKQADTLWFHANDSAWNPDVLMVELLTEEGKYLPLDSFRSKLPTYTLLRNTVQYYMQLAKDTTVVKTKQYLANGGELTDSIRNLVINAEIPWVKDVQNDSIAEDKLALVSYQQYYKLKNIGKMDSATKACLARPVDSILPMMYVNLERLRWMQQSFEPLYVLVNVPLMELFIRKDGMDAMHMEVVVGKSIRQTPSLNAKMANVVINPPWGVPPTIMKKDVLPGMSKSGAQYLAKKGLKVYDFKGKQVNASTVNASNYKKYVFRQDPGDDNALGYVKFNLPNKWDIYLHDTPHREDFGKTDRARSSGCIRVQKPLEMAEYILTELEGKRYPRERIDSVIQTHKTRYEVLSDKIPVHIVYLTAFEDNTRTHINFVRDIYRRDARLMALLK